MSFFPAHLRGGLTPRVRELPLAAAQSGKRGALLLQDGSGNFATCGADPASIAAVAASDYGTNSLGFNHLGVDGFPPGYMQGYLLTDEQPFHAQYVGTLPGAIGGSYGVVLDSDGLWKVDFTETVNTRLKLTKFLTTSPENRNRVQIVFLAANIQLIAG